LPPVNAASRVREGVDQQGPMSGHQARCDTLQKAGDGSAGVWSAAVMVSMQQPFERTTQSDAEVSAISVANHNLQASDMKLYTEA